MTANDSSATRRAEDERVRIRLSQEQVGEIARQLLRQGSSAGGDSANGYQHAGESIIVGWAKSPLLTDRRLSRSVLVGLLTLACFAPPQTERRLVDIAELLGLPASSVHRYIKTLVATGLLEQVPSTRGYRLAAGNGARKDPAGRRASRPSRTKD
jgi:IclR helix-turn-helix domain